MIPSIGENFALSREKKRTNMDKKGEQAAEGSKCGNGVNATVSTLDPVPVASLAYVLPIEPSELLGLH